MRTYLVAFALSLVMSLVLTRIVRDLAIRFGMFDEPVGGRKLHTRPIPRTGGVAVALAFALPLVGLALWRNDISAEFFQDTPLLLALFGGGGIILSVGLFDDLFDARARVKLAGQLAAALFVWWVGVRIEAFGVPMVGRVDLGMLSLPVTVFWLVLVTNAVNLIDGMDGLAGGVAVLAGGTLFVMSAVEGTVIAALLLASLVGATIGFLVYNINPASIFLGDTGSLLLGFMLGLISIHSSQKSYALFAMVAALLALGLPIFDLVLAVFRRALIGQPIFSADQNHIHHVMLRKGFNTRQSVGRLYLAAIVLEGAALTLILADDMLSAVVIVALGALIVVAVRFLGYGDIIRSGRRARILQNVQQLGAERQAAVEEARDALTEVRTADEVWQIVQVVAEELALAEVSLELQVVPLRTDQTLSYTWGGQRSSDVHIQSREERTFHLALGSRSLGHLRLVSLAEHQVLPPLDQALYRILADGVSHGLATVLDGGNAVAEARRDREAQPNGA